MSIPATIKGITLTAEERYKFVKNNLTRSIVAKRMSYGRKREELFEPRMNNRKVTLDGKEVTEEMLNIMHRNDLTIDRVKQRLYNGWSLKRAINTPVDKKKSSLYEIDEYEYLGEEKNYKMPKQEVIEVIGRIKYLNKQPETKGVICIPLRVRVRAKEYGVDINAVEELKV